MDERSELSMGTPPDEETMDMLLTEFEHAQVGQIARELAALLDLPEDARFLRATYAMLYLFVVDGGMPVARAIDTLERSLQLTLVGMAAHSRRH